ncbi:uncharacterized protein [Nicotiana sylvestris]|uniref:uncharacterized protein n=1 Tax=Nicotiana sylvestris TaxID=4096 RepID=UPI00388CE6BD
MRLSYWDNLAVDMNIQELLVIGNSDPLVPPNELNATSAPWPFAAWGMDVIVSIKPTASNGHRFIIMAIDYFTKWVEAASYKVVTKKVIADFVRDRIICRFKVPESIITDYTANLNSDLMKDVFETFKIKHKNSTAYTPQLNGAMEVANKNIKKILRKMKAELSDTEWVKCRYEQLALIDGKRMNVVCHGQLYQNRMFRAFSMRVKPRQFAPGQLALKRVFLYQDEAKGKFLPNWKGPYMVHIVLTGGALILAEMDKEVWPKPINSDAVKRYYA